MAKVFLIYLIWMMVCAFIWLLAVFNWFRAMYYGFRLWRQKIPMRRKIGKRPIWHVIFTFGSDESVKEYLESFIQIKGQNKKAETDFKKLSHGISWFVRCWLVGLFGMLLMMIYYL